jgi:DNA polymerase III epsilon subunit-like protein
MANYLVVDTETGGLIPGRHSLLEVGLAAYKNGEVVGRKQFYIKQEEYLVTPKAMEINKLDLAEVYKQGVTPRIGLDMIQNFIMQHFGIENPPKMLGQNVGFDRNFIKALFLSQNEDIDTWISHRVMDTQVLIQAAKDLEWLPADAPNSLHKFAKMMGYTPQGEHTAMGDIDTTVFAYEAIVGILKEGKPWEQNDSTTA